MVSKNNRIERMEQAAERQSHFGIRKLTIGAASVLLGTTLWLGNNANVAKADTNADKGDIDKANQETANPIQSGAASAKKAVVVANNDSAKTTETAKDANAINEVPKTLQEQTVQSSADATQNQKSTKDVSKDGNVVSTDKSINETLKRGTDIQVENGTKNTQTKQTEQSVQQSTANKVTESINNAAQSGKQTAANTISQDLNKAAKEGKSKSADQLTNSGVNLITKDQLASNTNSAQATVKNNQTDKTQDLKLGDLSSGLTAEELQANIVRGNAALVNNANATKFLEQSKTIDPTKQLTTAQLAKLNALGFNNVLAAVPTAATTQADDGSTKTVKSLSELQDALNDSSVKQINVDGQISATSGSSSFWGQIWGGLTASDINVNREVTINGTSKDATITLGSNAIINNSNLTLKDINIVGSIMGNGTLNIDGTVNSTVNVFNSKTLTNDQIKQQTGLGSNMHGASTDNWKAPNVQASKVNVEQGATLNINRDIDGDGINEPDHGIVNVGINSHLNINLKNAQYASRANEQSSSIENANAGIRILDNGTITTGDSAEVNIHAGHGRAIVIDEPFGGTSDVANNTSLEGWENGRTGDNSSRAASHRTQVVLGDSTKMNITGRGGLVLGDTATFVTGDHSIIHIDNQGNGEGLLLDANSRVEVSPHSQLLMTSDGKNASGYYGGGNYIGMGQSAQFRVEHDATFRYKVINSANNEKRPYADNFNIISQASNTHPEVYVGPNATFDGQSDYDDYYGEIFAYSLTSGANTSTVFQIDGAKYVNWEKNSQVIGHGGAGNLYYSMGPGLIDATNQKYFVFKWNNKNLNDNNYTFDDSTPDATKQSIQNFVNSSDKYWTDIEHLATKYSQTGNTAEWPGHVVSGSDIRSGSGYNPVDHKTGTPISNYNTGDGDNGNTTGFDPLNSQRLVLVATIIPTQEDDTKQEKDPYQVQIKYVDSLAPGAVQLVQKGVDGLKRTTTTTYYNVNPADGSKTLDTTKGDNGHSTKTEILSKRQDEIIYIGKQQATVNYIYQDTNGSQTQISSKKPDAASPVVTDSEGNVIFDEQGNPTANTITYNETPDLNDAKTQAKTAHPDAKDIVVVNDGWQDAVNNKTNVYDITGLTKADIQKAAEAGQTTVGPTNGPTYKVILESQTPEKQNAQITVNYVDQDSHNAVLHTDNLCGKIDDPINNASGQAYSTTPEITTLEGQGYELVSDGYKPGSTNFTQDNNGKTYTVVLKHKHVPVNPTTPDKHGINPDQVIKNVQEIVHYEGAGAQTPSDNTQTSQWTRTVTVDAVTNQIIPNGDLDTPWAIPDGQKKNYHQVNTPVVNGYYADQANVPQTAVTQDNIYKVVTYKPIGHIIPVDKDGNQIPSQDHPQFPNNPSDPTKANPGTKPTVPGYHPETGKPGDPVNPDATNPGNDVPVVYVKNEDDQTLRVKYIDDGPNDPQDLSSYNVTINAEPGDALNYDTKGSIAELVNKGYQLVNDAYTQANLGNKMPEKGGTYEVHLKHTTQTINPDHPGNPGILINPTDPTGPVWPTGTDAYSLRTPASETIHYVFENGKPAGNDNIQTGHFDHELVFDKVTGKQIEDHGWTPGYITFKDITTPEIPGYTPDQVSVKGDTVTKDHPTTEHTVIYKKNATDVTGDIKYIDDSENGAILKEDSFSGLPGNKIEYTTQDKITDYENKGYLLVSNNFKDNDETFKQTGNNFEVHLKHGTTPVTPTTPGKPGEPINPNDPNGPKYPDGTDAESLTKTVTRDFTYKFTDNSSHPDVKEDPQSITFTGNAVLDKVTGQYVTIDKDGNITGPGQMEWNPENGTLKAVDAKKVDGYHIISTSNANEDGSVGTETVNRNSNDIHVVITYAKDTPGEVDVPSTQVVHYIDGDTKQSIYRDTTTSFTFTKQGQDGKWNKDSHTYAGGDVPVIDGYVAEEKTYQGKTATPDNPNVEVTVIYHKVGKIIPVDPTGNPIPNAPTPTYTNDPNDPTKVTPDEPTPTVPGYTPDKPTVTPDKPTEDTPVIYRQAEEQKAQVQYIDLDDNNRVMSESDILTGKAGDKIDYSTAADITNYEKKGYVLANDGFSGNPIFDNVKDNTQIFKVTFHHGQVPVNPNTPDKHGVDPNQIEKDVKETVHYTGAGDKTPGDHVQNSKWTRTVTVDTVTNKIVENGQYTTDWSIPKGKKTVYDQVNTPVINGYHADQASVPATAVTQEDITKVVNYTPNGKIIPVDPSGKPIPNAPTPQYPTDPNDPTKVTPNEPVPTIPGYTPKVPSVTPTDPGKDTPVPYTPDTPAKDQVAIVNYVDADENNKKITDSGNLTGKAGTKIDYSTASTIKDLENKGYVLVNDGFPAGAVYDNDDNTIQTYTVVLKHGTVPVTPDKPGKPGEPINPNDPDGPKWPNGTGEDSLKKTGTQTIHYVYSDGRKAKDDNVQSFDFTKSAVVDKVTGAIISQTGWNVDSHTFGNVDTPVIDGYHADKHTAGGTTITPEDLTKEVTVTYTPNGKIIPVDPNGNPIPNAPTPTYTNDPTDPTKVTPDEPTPNVPGYTPSTPTVTPTDPGKDTPVPYTPETPAKDQVAIVNYVDSDEGNKVITTSGNLTGKAGAKIDYSTASTIQDLENKGYVLVNDGFPAGAVYDNDDNTTQTYTVVLKHGTVPVTPTDPGKPGEPINPNDPDGPKWPDGTGEDSLKKTGTQTIHYVYSDGRKAKDDNVQSFDFTKSAVVDKVTGAIISQTGWNVDSHTFGNVDTPVIDGYHADKRTAGGTTITPEDLTKEVTVTYTPNGKIIPVDPNGKPIPNVPTPTYPTDPTDPTKVTPDEPTPTIPGYTPSTPTVTPTDPGKDTPVPYTPETPAKDQVAIVNYVDADEGNKLITTSGNLSGKAGAKIDYSTASTIQDLENKGYVLVNDGFPAGAVYDNDDNTTQTYTVVLKHGTTTITPDKPGKPGEPINPNDPNGPKWSDNTGKDNLTKTGTQTIHYTGAGDKTPKDDVQSFTFTKTMVVDNVTGKVVTDGSWNVGSHTFGNVDTPVVDGYHADKRTAGGTTITPEDLTKEVTVTYTPNGKIIPVDPNGKPIPNVPTPTYPTDPSDPTKVVPDEPVPTIPGMTPSTPTVTPTDPGKDTPVPYNPVVNDKGEVNIFVHDNTTGQNLTDYGYNSGSEDVGTKVSYDKTKVITELTNKGYKVINPDVTIPGEIAKGTTNVTIYVEHDIVPVTPDKPGKPGEPINPNDPNGPKYPNGTDTTDLTRRVTRTINFVSDEGTVLRASIDQTIIFTANGELDKVTGKWTKTLTWSPDQQVNGMDVPFIDGYHVVNISKDGNGLKSITSVTLNHNDKDYSVNVVYGENGHIIPVDPNGNPIPDAPQPQFPTDPSDPSKTIPGTKPSVPGYQPESGKPGDPVDPGNNRGDNVNVPYTKNPDAVVVTGSVTYIDKTTGQTLKIDDLKGNVGDKITYTTAGTIADYENKGYKLVENTFKDGQETFTKDGNKFTVTLEHATAPVGPNNPHEPDTPINPNDPNGPKWPEKDNYSKDYTSTVHFVDDQGKQLKPDKTQTSTWTRTLIIDKVTGEITNPDESWKSNIDTYKSTTVPVIDGYVADTKSKNGNTVGKTLPGEKAVEKNIEDSVVYHKIGKIVPVDPSGNPIPGADQPQYKNDPTDPTKVTPNEPVPNVPGYTPSQNTITPVDPAKDTPVVYNQNVTPTPTPEPTPVTVTGKQTITFVDGDNGNTPLRDPDVQTHKFTNGESSYTFGTINVPVIDGYVAEVKTAGGKTVTPENPDANVTVVYHKIGKIVPVDPSGNPIPGADQPQYKNDPTDPTKVVPDEPVPNVPGYTPSENSVTPVDPTKDTQVIYTKKETPKKPETPKTPEEPSTPEEPKKPTTPKKENNKPKPTTPKPTPNYNNNIAPHSQNGYWNNNIAPHATSVNGWTNNIGPHGETVDANGNIVAPNGEIIGYVDANGNPHYTKSGEKSKTLPQTGEKTNDAAAVLGGLSAGLGLIGLAGVKKRRRKED
ncbi:mucin-binding protein [Lactobacillus intestinalis]|nr:YSIRK-type signal peptide-containing protein [Lactobacillus intestinalis]